MTNPNQKPQNTGKAINGIHEKIRLRRRQKELHELIQTQSLEKQRVERHASESYSKVQEYLRGKDERNLKDHERETLQKLR